MGTDYTARKLAKKQWKKAGSSSQADGKGRKRKPGAKRRLCQGMCYSEPVLTGEDKAWSDGPSDHYDSDVEAPQKAPPKPLASMAAEDSRSPIRPAKRVRMSTSVGIAATESPLPPAGAQQQQAHQSAGSGADQSTGKSAALATFPAEVQRVMQAEGFAEATPVQLRCWPPILAGRDVQAVAQPGSGKTFGYLLPAVPKLLSAKQASSPCTVLVLVPTRELAQQVADSCSSLRKLYKLRVACIVGGSDRAAQARSLAGRPDFIVATPGRLIDLADSASSALKRVAYVVLDEADKMLSLGFEAQLDQIWASIAGSHKGTPDASSQRPQVLLFTATMPAKVATAAAQWQRDPVCIDMHQADASPASHVSQVVQVCAEHKKTRKLQRHLEQVKANSEQDRSKPRILVFCNKVKTVRFVHALCVDAGFKAAMLHGERSQPEREAALQAFKNGTAQILVATDVAGRGLHIKNLPYIVNYDFPSRMEAYIHRVGRTGRLSSSGHAFSFFTRNLAPLARPLLDHLLDHDQSVDPNLVKLADAFDIASAKLKEASEGAEGVSSPALPSADPGTKSKTGRVEGKKKRSRESDGSSTQKKSTLDATQVAASSLPGLYKSGHVPEIDPDALGDYNSDSESGGTATATCEKLQMLKSQVGPADDPHVVGRHAAMANEQEPVRQKSSRLPGLQALKEPHVVSSKEPSRKQLSRKTVPGRLRKKLAKECLHASQGLMHGQSS